MSAGGWFFLYLLQIGFAVFVASSTSKDANVPRRVQAARSMAIWWCLIPLVIITLLAQVGAYCYYRAHLSRTVAERGRLQQSLPTSFGTPAVRAQVQPGPAGGSGGKPARSPGENPFL